jgi:hypothetical protein
MSIAYSVLGQVAPSATTLTTLYTGPASTQTVCSSLVVCNRGAAAGTFRVAIRVGGAGISNEDYLYYDLTLAAYDTFVATIGITLAATDVVSVYASSGDFSFNLFGSKHT